MHFSYWEDQELIGKNDVIVIGSGITGLSTAIHLKKTAPNLKVTILERGMIPWGASSKNAGFACFGSLGEIIDDLAHTPLDNVIELMKYRYEGLKIITGLLGKENMDYKGLGGYELFTPAQKDEFEHCKSRIEEFNALLKDDFGPNVYEVATNDFGFNGIIGIIKNNYEGQIDTGKMMNAYMALAKQHGVNIINGAEVDALEDTNQKVIVKLKGGMEISTGQVIVCANGFAKRFVNDDVNPARAQVLITKPIENLPFEGTFHYDKGYYYFRNIHNRVLFGGGRNLNITGETTENMECTELIMNKLKELLQTVILPNTNYEIDYSWAGTMGVGSKKTPIVKNISNNISCAVRLGGMGVALGTSVGNDAAKLYFSK